MRKELRHEIEDRLFKYCDAACSEWDAVIADRLKIMDRQQRQFFVMRYVEKMSEKDICRELHIERSTYYRWLQGIVSDVAIAAAYNQLLKP